MTGPAQEAFRTIKPGENFFTVARELQPLIAKLGVPDVTLKDCVELVRLIRVFQPSPILLKKLDDPASPDTNNVLFVGERLPMDAVKTLGKKTLRALVNGLRNNAETESEMPGPISGLKPPAKPKKEDSQTADSKNTKKTGLHPKSSHTDTRPKVPEHKFLSFGEAKSLLTEIRNFLPDELKQFVPKAERLLTQILIESNLDTHAKPEESSASGLTQFIKRTAHDYWDLKQTFPEELRTLANAYAAKGYRPKIEGNVFNPEYLKNPVVAIWMQEKYLADLKSKYMKRFGDSETAERYAFMAYRVGEPIINASIARAENPSSHKPSAAKLAREKEATTYADKVLKSKLPKIIT